MTVPGGGDRTQRKATRARWGPHLFGPNPADALLGRTEPATRCVLRCEIFLSHLVNIARLEAA
jgi:hypothetical protein